MVGAMLGARAVEGAAVALLRLLLLLLLLPALRGPGLGVVGSAGAGLPESVIWAVNAGGEAHVDVHGIHFRKDPLEGRVGRGESPSRSRGILGLPCRLQPAEGCGLRVPSLSLGPCLWSEVSLRSFLRDPGTAQSLALTRSYQEPLKQRAGKKLYLDLAACIFLTPRLHSSWEKSRDEGGLLPPRGLTVVGYRCFWPAWVCSSDQVSS